jgi:hypothetical protein
MQEVKGEGRDQWQRYQRERRKRPEVDGGADRWVPPVGVQKRRGEYRFGF